MPEYLELIQKDEFSLVNMIVDVPKTEDAVVSKVGAVASSMAGMTYAMYQYDSELKEKNNLREIKLTQSPEEFEFYLQDAY